MNASLLILFLCAAGSVLGATAPERHFSGSDKLDTIVNEAVEKGEIPGAVLLVGHEGRIIHHRAYGYRALEPEREAMTLDTIFDVASLTKVLATAPALAKLLEEGRLRLNDRVNEYLPEFQDGDSPITVRELVTHFSGLRPDLDLEPAWSGYQTGVRLALHDKPVAAPGERFIYSDINYILLAEIVQRLTGTKLAEYVERNFYEPLGMDDTGFEPSLASRDRIAPTEILPGAALPLRGVVHDPTARYMGGVAGHAGVFATATDVGRFAAMMLGMGEYRGKRVLSPLTVRKMTEPQTPADQPVLRGIGWDIDSPYSTNRGELLPLGSYGHTGFTGTSVWIDPVTRTYIVLMTNRVHPDGGGSVVSLRCRVATAVAAALGIETPGVSLTGYNETLAGIHRRTARNGQTLAGLDVLAAEKFNRLRGRKVGLITNHTGLSRDGERNVDLMLRAGIDVVALFSPEHGISGDEDRENISDSRDERSGLPVRSLYVGKSRKPSREMLAGVDVLVFDIQDAGARFYTYMCTMVNAMEAAASNGVAFLVLDRPNPITGVHVEGPLLEDDLRSFIGCVRLPIRHGMTLGEIARMANEKQKIGVRLEVVAMKGWERGDWFDNTGLVWIDPSPNLRGLNATTLYPGVAMLEGASNYSVGRGTDAPFEQIGADWIVGRDLAAYLNGRHLAGVRVYPTRFMPRSSNFAGKSIEGVRFVITDRELVDSVRLGLEIAVALEKLYPGRIDWESNLGLIGSRETVDAIRRGEDPATIQRAGQATLANFLSEREPYLLYH